jgi:cold shock CspA family protein/ribosome-associated translation inhibitor RaiA
MQTPLQITFRHMPSSPAVEARARELATRLEHFHEHIIGCHVTIDAPAAHRHHGAPYTIKIDLGLPGRDVHVNSERAAHDAHTDIYVALRDAFDTATRLLEDRARQRRGDVKHHELPSLGAIADIDNAAGHGRITGDDGHDVFFHRNSVHGTDFLTLSVGNVVEYEAQQGNQGLQASAVRLWRNSARQGSHQGSEH